MSTATGDMTQSTRSGVRGAGRSLFALLDLLEPFRWQMALGILLTIARQVCSLGAALTGAYLVGLAATGHGSDDLIPWLILLGLLVLGRGLGYWAEMWIVHVVAYRVLAVLRKEVYDALERLAPSYLIDKRSGDLASVMMADAEATEIFYAHTINTFIAALVVPTGALLYLYWMNPWLGLVLTPWVIAVLTTPLWLRRRAEREGRELRERIGVLNADVVDGVQGLREVVVFGRETAQLDRIIQQGTRLVSVQMRHGRRSGSEAAAGFAMRALGMVSVLAIAALLVSRGELNPTLYPVAVILAFYVFEPLDELIAVAREFGPTFAAADRIMAILHTPAPVTDRADALPHETSEIEPAIEFDSVSFQYQPHLPEVLSQVTFTVSPGETVALVGRSGAGKSTCTNLLMRFWDVQSGAIRIGGHDIRDLPQDELRDLIALVPQDTYLFSMPLRENIRLGKPDATDDEVEEACRLARANEFLQELPDGFETSAGERGVQLSGGQRQRIAIARALLKDAPILIMDEAVSNLDTENERELQVAIDQVRAGRTTIVVAHRLSTIRNTDRIVVLDAGRVVESGTHADLLALDGVYSSLVASQQDGLLLE